MSCDSKKYIPLAKGNISFTVLSSQKTDINVVAAMFMVGSDDGDASDSDFFAQADLKYRQMKKERKEEEQEAVKNMEEVRTLYGTAHCLEMEVIKHDPNKMIQT